MTNREKYITKRDEYDLMMAIAEKLEYLRESWGTRSIKSTSYIRSCYDLRYCYVCVKDHDFDAKESVFDRANKDLSKKVVCPIDLVSGEHPKLCKLRQGIDSALFDCIDIGSWEEFIDCKGCIQAWLNEEAKP